MKKLLKAIKLNESTISMILGIIVILIVGSLVISYLRNRGGSVPEELLNGENSVEVESTTHKVAAGENLWSIAEKYYEDGNKWVDIAEENKLENASVITEGQDLKIPDADSLDEGARTDDEDFSEEGKATPTPAPTHEHPAEDDKPEESITASSYDVVRGDNLWNIAVRAYGDGYKWVDIARENKLANPDIIHAGNKLTLPR